MYIVRGVQVWTYVKHKPESIETWEEIHTCRRKENIEGRMAWPVISPQYMFLVISIRHMNCFTILYHGCEPATLA